MTEIIYPSTKICTKCGETKPLVDFDYHPQGKYKLRSHCRICRTKYQNELRKLPKHKEKRNALRRTPDAKARRNAKGMTFQQRMKHNERARSPKWRKRINEHRRKLYAENPAYKLITNIRNRINTVLKRNTKKMRTLEYLGCSVEELRIHLESKFKEGMSWENKGFYGWHIDHIKPISSFDLSDIEEQKKAFHYTNLQPLWALDNLKKSDKYH